MNAKQEFITTFSREEVIAAKVSYREREVILYEGYTDEEWDEFLSILDFNYNDGFGSQEVYGKVWLTNGRWAIRWEYEGSEGWEINMIPEIPKRPGEQ